MKRKYNMILLESMMLSKKIQLTEEACVFPDGWNQAKGDAFRQWFNKQYPSKSDELSLDPTGPFDNTTIKNAFCWKPDGLQTAGDKYLGTAGYEPTTVLGWPLKYYLIAVIGIVVVSGIGFMWWFKIRRAALLARAVKDGIKNYKGDKAELLHDTIEAVRDPSKRRNIIRKIIDRDPENKLTTAEEKEKIEEFANNPGAFEKTLDELHKLYLEEFKAGRLTADEYIRAVRMNPNSVEARALRAIERARKKTGNKSYWPKKNIEKRNIRKKLGLKPVKSNPKLFYKLIGNSDDLSNSWFLFKSSSRGGITQQAIDRAFSRALNSSNLPPSTSLPIKAGPSPSILYQRLKGAGKRLLAKHANAEQFPNINQWTIEMNRAGATPPVGPGDMARYIQDKALWDLIRGR